jgi:hypothetical protein
MERIHVALQDESTSLNGNSGERIRPNDRGPVQAHSLPLEP